MRLIIQVTIK